MARWLAFSVLLFDRLLACWLACSYILSTRGWQATVPNGFNDRCLLACALVDFVGPVLAGMRARRGVLVSINDPLRAGSLATVIDDNDPWLAGLLLLCLQMMPGEQELEDLAALTGFDAAKAR